MISILIVQKLTQLFSQDSQLIIQMILEKHFYLILLILSKWSSGSLCTLTFYLFCSQPNKAKIEKEEYKPDGKTYYMTEYFPSHYVDRFWKQLMVQDDTYERFCYEFVRGYIHRDIDNNPISFRPFEEFEDEENPLSHRGFGKKKHDAFIRYKRTRRHIIRDKDIIKPFFNLWPKYPSQSCFFTELKYEVTIRQSTIYDIINYIDHQYQSEPDLLKSSHYVIELADLTAQTQARFTQASDEIHLKPHIKNKTNDNKLCNHAYKI